MIGAEVRIFVCPQPVDMRWGFDRLAWVAEQAVGEDPRGGALFVFGNRAGNRLKILWYDRNGYCILYKRFHRALIELPLPGGRREVVRIDGAALARVLAGVPRERKRRSGADLY